jgi:hypothetical protein
MKVLLAPGQGEWPYGFGLDEYHSGWAVWAITPCCLEPVKYEDGPRCSKCNNLFEDGYSDVFHPVDEEDLEAWIAAWLGWDFDAETTKVRVKVKW